MKRLHLLLLFILLTSTSRLFSQWSSRPDATQIKSIQLFKPNDPTSLPILLLGANDQLELHFDDMEGGIKYYYYTLQLCNSDWSEADVPAFDYTRGFISNRIYSYRQSSLTPIKYTHYQTLLPERNSGLTKGGNYLLKVYLNDDTSRLAFQRRILVVNKKAMISSEVLQPFNGNLMRTHQRLRLGVNIAGSNLSVYSPKDLKVVIVKNNDWTSAVSFANPTLYRGDYFEYDDERTNFAGGKEWRWVDLRTIRLRTDRVKQIIDSDSSDRVDIFVNPDGEKGQQPYLYYRDLDGLFYIESKDAPNSYWQSDYAWVHFTYVPPARRAIAGKDIYLNGALTNYMSDPSSKMIFNEEKGQYEAVLYLKQGYYNYSYITKNSNGSMENSEGDYWGTENQYLILTYYKPFGGRADDLIGFSMMHSVYQR